MEAYEKWFLSAGEPGALRLAAVRLLGLFDRPADPACLAALRAEPVIAGLTDPLADLRDAQWNIALQQLVECGLIYPVDGNAAVDAHPLVREYFATQLREHQPEAWREGHRRLYEYLKSSVPHRPDGLAGLQPLYQAVAHGCKAGLYEEARAEVYRDRILRGTGNDGFYSWRKLGAFGADLGAVACFFDELWKRLAPGLSEPAQAWLLNEAAFRLRALGRLTESLEPMRVSGEIDVQRQEWEGAAISYSNLSQLELTLGELAAAVRDAEQSLEFADRSGDAFQRMGKRIALADARHQTGARSDAQGLFSEAESIQALELGSPLLYSVQGFLYCDLLLSEGERVAWAASFGPSVAATDRPKLKPPLDVLREIEDRATQALKIAQEGGLSLLTHALDRLTLGRVALYRAILEGSSFEPARQPLTAAVDGLRASGNQHHLPRGLLSRAWLRFLEGDSAGATADLDEAWQIAERGGMKLHMADILLHRARLFRDRAALEAAARLIEETGYHRRDGELADAREALETLAG